MWKCPTHGARLKLDNHIVANKVKTTIPANILTQTDIFLLCELSEREVLKNKKPVCMEVAMGLVQEILYRVLNG